VTLAEKTSPKTVADGSVQKASVIKGNGNGASITVDGDGVHGSQLSFPGTDSTSATHVAKSTAPTPFAMRPNFSVRMTRRNALFAERKRLSDYALVFSVFGIVLMIIETELTMAHVYEKVNILLLLLRLLRHFFHPDDRRRFEIQLRTRERADPSARPGGNVSKRFRLED
jgi:hypothetical protein